MVSYRIITLLALAVTGVIAAPCEAGNGNNAAGTGVAAASNAQATGAAGNAMGGAGGNAQGGAGGNAQGASGGAANAQGGAGGACPPVTTNDAQGPDNVGVDGAQFVTGQCTSDANCASGCCVQGGGSDPNLAVCRNEPALSDGEACGFSCSG